MSLNPNFDSMNQSRTSAAVAEFFAVEREFSAADRLEESDLVELGILSHCKHCPEEDFHPFNLLED